jgi:hypothetical protein
MVESCPAEAVPGGRTQIVDPPAQARRRGGWVPFLPASEGRPSNAARRGARLCPLHSLHVPQVRQATV